MRGSGTKATVTKNSFQSLTIEGTQSAGELVATKEDNTQGGMGPSLSKMDRLL